MCVYGGGGGGHAWVCACVSVYGGGEGGMHGDEVCVGVLLVCAWCMAVMVMLSPPSGELC